MCTPTNPAKYVIKYVWNWSCPHSHWQRSGRHCVLIRLGNCNSSPGPPPRWRSLSPLPTLPVASRVVFLKPTPDPVSPCRKRFTVHRGLQEKRASFPRLGQPLPPFKARLKLTSPPKPSPCAPPPELFTSTKASTHTLETALITACICLRVCLSTERRASPSQGLSHSRLCTDTWLHVRHILDAQ